MKKSIILSDGKVALIYCMEYAVSVKTQKQIESKYNELETLVKDEGMTQDEFEGFEYELKGKQKGLKVEILCSSETEKQEQLSYNDIKLITDAMREEETTEQINLFDWINH